MTTRGLSILLGALLAGCSAGGGGNQAAPKGEGPSDRPTANACTGSFDYEHCVAWLPAERMTGVWISGFERSAFVPGAMAMPAPDEARQETIWLDFAAASPPDPALRRAMDDLRSTAFVAIEFVGRRSRDEGAYGHDGNGRHVVIVDRIISARLLGSPGRRAELPPGPCVGPLSPAALANCDFGPAERIEGVWVTGFEQSQFVPAGTGGRDPKEAPVPRAWLAFAPGVAPDPALRAEIDKRGGANAVGIIFIGRRARAPGQVVVVDRIISARILGPALR
jgi:hypothetical protein